MQHDSLSGPSGRPVAADARGAAESDSGPFFPADMITNSRSAGFFSQRLQATNIR